MEYTEYPIPEDLQDAVRCIWSLVDASMPMQDLAEPVLPDGCPELILNTGTPFFEHKGGRFDQQPPRFLYGQLTKALHLRPAGPCSMLGVRLQPHGAYALFGTVGVVRDTRVLLEILDAELDHAVLRILEQPLTDRVNAVSALLQACERQPVEAAIRDLVRAIEEGKDDRALNELKASIPLSVRQLERRFQAVVGLRPALFARIVRLRRLVDHLRKGESASFTQLAHTAGYYDQAHFNRDLKAFTGLSPRRYFGQDLVLPTYFSGVQ